MGIGGRLKEVVKKYGKVAIGVHCSVSAVSITGLYIALKNNADVDGIFEAVGIGGVSKKDRMPEVVVDQKKTDCSLEGKLEEKKRCSSAEVAASSGGLFALAILCNKALFPIRVPITIALTPPIWRFLARKGIVKV